MWAVPDFLYCFFIMMYDGYMSHIAILNKEIEGRDRLESKALEVFDNVAKYFVPMELPSISILFHTTRQSYDKSLNRSTQIWEVGNTSRDNKIDIIHPDHFESISDHDKSEFEQILAHEIAHIFINRTASGNVLPLWLNEGLSMVIAGQSDKYKASGPICLEKDFSRELADQRDWDQRANYGAYKISCLFTAFIVEKFSFIKVLELVKRSDRNHYAPRFEALIERVLERDIVNLEKDFILWLDKIV